MSTDIEVRRSLLTAVRSCKTDEALDLLHRNPDCLQIETPFGSWLHVAASSGDLVLTKNLVAAGIEVNRRGGTFDGTAINLAASSGHYDIVVFLLNSGAELDVTEPERNPLFAAIFGGHGSIVELLVRHGIDYRIKYSGRHMKSMSAIEFANERGQTTIAEYLKSLPG
ncbi:ankyrin repeat domain-containing protein [Roseateles sp. BYS180W]|uniref:Ankyrin repeat domain-containing protein n=1 Tax=Roseateles rivi TaxID=3299028 RepID=A0ABW7FR79_9BURK